MRTPSDDGERFGVPFRDPGNAPATPRGLVRNGGGCFPIDTTTIAVDARSHGRSARRLRWPHPCTDVRWRAAMVKADRAHRLVIPADSAVLELVLELPPDPHGVVIFACGGGSGLLSPRHGAIARRLRGCGLATVLVDLVALDGEADRRRVLDVSIQARRLELTANAVARANAARGLPLAYFGSSTGAAAALVASIDDPRIGAVVCGGGRPDLAEGILHLVVAPTLLVVGEHDGNLRALHDRVIARLGAEKTLVVVPGAGHLFEEPGALDAVSGLACDWFCRHLRAALPEGARC